jgi:hypothetical protein
MVGLPRDVQKTTTVHGGVVVSVSALFVCSVVLSFEWHRRSTGWMIGGSSLGRGWEFFSSPPRPDRLLGPPCLLPMGTRGSFPRGKAAGE